MRINAQVGHPFAIVRFVAPFVCAMTMAAHCQAETLTQAFAHAYRNNPAIDRERARLRAVDENVTIARSGYRPNLSASGSLSWDNTKSSDGGVAVIGPAGQVLSDGESKSADYEITLTQPIFTGLQVTNAVRAAEAQVRAGQEAMRSTEHALFLQVANAYTSVLNARSLLPILEAAVRDASRELQRTRRRLSSQDATKTDVAQAEALRAAALADLAAGRSQLKSARAIYVQVVGHEPRRLVEPRLTRSRLPRSLPNAISIAMREHPVIAGALYGEQAARSNVDAARGRLLPQVSLEASYGETFTSEESGDNSSTETTSVTANVTVPIYAGGQTRAEIRRAKHIHVSTLQQIEVQRAAVRQRVTTAWAQLEAAKKQLEFQHVRIRANKAAIVGIRKEEAIGQRTLSELFLAQRDLLQAQTGMLAARREVTLASYRVMSEIGRLNPEDQLPPNAPVYDPSVHYEKVRRKWFGVSIIYPNGRREYLNTSASKGKPRPRK